MGLFVLYGQCHGHLSSHNVAINHFTGAQGGSLSTFFEAILKLKASSVESNIK
jgi:hypothetical protein